MPLEENTQEVADTGLHITKGFVVAVITVLALVIAGFSAFGGLGDTSKYKGMIQQVESQTKQLQVDEQN